MVSVKNQNRMKNSVDPDEMAPSEPSHQGLNCLQKKAVFWSAGLKEFSSIYWKYTLSIDKFPVVDSLRLSFSEHFCCLFCQI